MVTLPIYGQIEIKVWSDSKDYFRVEMLKNNITSIKNFLNTRNNNKTTFMTSLLEAINLTLNLVGQWYDVIHLFAGHIVVKESVFWKNLSQLLPPQIFKKSFESCKPRHKIFYILHKYSYIWGPDLTHVPGNYKLKSSSWFYLIKALNFNLTTWSFNFTIFFWMVK